MLISKLQFESSEKRDCFVRRRNNGGLAMTPPQRFQLLNFNKITWVLFGVWLLAIGFYASAYALDLDKLKVYFLQGDYKAAIAEGEKAVAQNSGTSGSTSDELYYLLALSYLKDENFFRAEEIFQLFPKEFKNSKFKAEAKLGLGDSFLLRGDFNRADDCYRELLKDHPDTKLKPLVISRLSETSFKKGDAREGQKFLDQMNKEFPNNSVLKTDNELCFSAELRKGAYYSIQVGSFSRPQNASGLADKLKASGYDAYIEEADSGGVKAYRVKVGKLNSRSEAVKLEERLSLEGYPTKICP